MAPKRETALDVWGRELAYACEAAALTGKQLAERLHVAPSTVSQWMNGRRTPHLDDVNRCDEALGTNGYLGRYFEKWVTREIPAVWTDRWLSAEAHANMIQNYDLAVIPGLLQTPDYARAVIQFNRHLSIDIDELVRRRMSRQAILNDENPPMCIFVIDEYVLRRMVGDKKVMFDQLAHVRDLAQWSNIVVKIVPAGTNCYAGGPFMIAKLDGVEIANLDTALRGQVIEKPEQVAEIGRIWEDIRELALSPKDSLTLIERVAKEWEA
ncbi:helix-turn-helix transcriptional regulator [Actinoallomurus purpureus]|uniref:helix-turn-helix domain-containing protein n=1 Tax=Actinoallomurus purpureus TaxID=478114 RepID=UPI002092A728|nr:helix-turn-helix transcriptional regulator [Actinoallomurus purpureus]MCO6010757.1 helix-turn-helix transcriptional regulator [Actinoallomurus purpureus]